MTLKTQRSKTTEPIKATPMDSAEQPITLDRGLQAFMRECMSCQSPAIATWATKILRARQMTMADLTRCLNLGFEG